MFVFKALLVIPQPTPIDYGNILQPPSNVAIIYCIVRNVSSVNDFTTRWFVNTTTELHPSDKYILDRGTGEIVPGVFDFVTDLVIRYPTYGDAGNYTCLVSPNPTLLGTQQSSSATQQLVLPSKSLFMHGRAIAQLPCHLLACSGLHLEMNFDFYS